MAELVKEAATVRHVLESIFCYFDKADLWSPQHGLALSIISDMQSAMDNSGRNVFSM